MKVVSLLGSAKKIGNTATVLGWVKDELKSLGHAVERIHLSLKSINGCERQRTGHRVRSSNGQLGRESNQYTHRCSGRQGRGVIFLLSRHMLDFRLALNKQHEAHNRY